MKKQLTFAQAVEIKARLAAGDKPKVIAFDMDTHVNNVYNVKNGVTFAKDYKHERGVKRIERVTKAIEQNPNTSLRKLVKASRVTFKNFLNIEGLLDAKY